tara:strand:- start:66014 stop:66199 length:186 start_codon:yes stop_codon:yes gene_type:complete
MNYEEFIKTTYHTRLCIVIPLMNRHHITKTQFFVKGKYSIEKEKEHLQKIYNLNENRIKKW